MQVFVSCVSKTWTLTYNGLNGKTKTIKTKTKTKTIKTKTKTKTIKTKTKTKTKQKNKERQNNTIPKN